MSELLQEDIPQTPEEFEKAINQAVKETMTFLKYMACRHVDLKTLAIDYHNTSGIIIRGERCWFDDPMVLDRVKKMAEHTG